MHNQFKPAKSDMKSRKPEILDTGSRYERGMTTQAKTNPVWDHTYLLATKNIDSDEDPPSV